MIKGNKNVEKQVSSWGNKSTSANNSLTWSVPATDLHSLVRIIWLLLLLLLLRGLRYALLLIVLVIQRRVEARVLRHTDAELLEGGVVEDGVLVAG